MKKITIHQPDFMPWLGLFNKINNSDELIVLDHVQNNPRNGSWLRRVKLLSNSEAKWLAIPLVKEKKRVFIPINEMEVQIAEKGFVKRNVTTIQQNYSKAPFFDEVFYLVTDFFNHSSNKLIDRNWGFMHEVMNRLEINTKFIFSSDLKTEKKSTELLIELLLQREADIYLCGDGSAGYQEDELYNQNNIELEFNNFKHPVYCQIRTNEFQRGLSIIDALMNLGFDGVKKLLRE